MLLQAIKTHSSDVEEWTDITFFAISALEDEKEFYESLIDKFEKATAQRPDLLARHKGLQLFHKKLERIEAEIDLGYDILDDLDQGIIPDVLKQAA
ncbi:MAG: hypothetical protein AAF244_00260 [Pseudomonadota bacterium]